MANRYAVYLTTCKGCGSRTSKKYASQNDGQCKACVTGVAPLKSNRKAFNGHCEDAPCCGCCGPQAEPEKYYAGYNNDY